MMYLASLDEATKDKVEGYKFIHTREELDAIVAANLESNKVVIRQDFIHEFFTPTGFVEYLRNVKKINLNLTVELDTTDIIVTRDVVLEKLKKCRTVEEVIDLAVFHDVEFMDTLDNLIAYQDTDRQQMLGYSNQIARLQGIIDDLRQELAEKDYALKMETDNKLLYQSQFHALVSRINYQYNKSIDPNKMFEVDSNSYDKILYIKEITRVQYIDTLVYYLKEILKTLYSMPTRILVVESYYAGGKIPLYPNLKPHHNLIERDVISGDILMLGMQPNIMQDILRNSSNISILIVLDRGGYEVPHIHGDNVETIYTVSDLKDKPEWIPDGRVISYDESTLFINHVKGFDEMDSSARISAYSSMSIVKQLVALLERK